MEQTLNETRDLERQLQAVRAQLTLLETAVKDMREAVVITDNEPGVAGLKILFVNDSAEQLTGYTREELIGQPIHIFHGPKTDPQILKQLKDAMTNGEPMTVETINYRKDESEYICNWSVSPIRDEEGRITRWVSVQRDVTDLRRSEEELIHGRKLRAVGELAGGIAHEFKNLLTPMLLQIQSVSDELEDKPDLMNELTVVKEAITKAKDLSERVLVLGRKTATSNEWNRLDELIEENLKLIRKTIDRRIDVVTSIKENCPPMWICRSSFSQVLLNLVLNARDTLLEKLQEPHPQAYIPRITVSLERAEAVPPAFLSIGNKALMCQRFGIEDNGKGVSQELCERMFDPFFTTKGPQRGTGLGLSLVWNLVHAMGGWVSVQSAVDIGTRMLIFIPEPANSPPPEEEPAPEVETQAKDTVMTATHANILLVEDEPMVAKAMELPLKRQGFEVTLANDGREGLEQIRQNPERWNVIISDLNMPNMHGSDFVRRLREETEYQGKIVIVTGYVAEEDMQKLQNTNVDAILNKPVSREELISCVHKLL